MTFDHVAQNATVLNTAFPQMAVGGGEFIVDPALGPNHPGMGGQNCVVEKEPYEALVASKNDLLDARTKFEAVGDRQTVDWINRAVEYIDFQATYPVYACCCCCAEYDTHMGWRKNKSSIYILPFSVRFWMKTIAIKIRFCTRSSGDRLRLPGCHGEFQISA
jgi:hypothetical protein